MIELTIIVIALLGVLLVREHQRTAEQSALLATVDALCQRLQAPELAIAEHAAEHQGVFAPPAVPLDDDAAHWESKEDLALRLEAVSNGSR